MANTYLTYTQQSPSTVEGQKFTLSMWVKKCANGTSQGLYGNTYSNTHRGYIYFTNGDYLSFYDSSGIHVETNRKFRDNNAFYHIVISADTTQGTASDRIKFYINGVQETSFSTASYPTQNDGMKLMSTTNTPNMGRLVEAGTSYYLQGAISHAHLTQGYTYDASAFGETDTTTGEWKAKTSPSVTYGTNGFFILKDGNGITDQSGEGNNFTLGGGTLTDLKDNPDNVFATMNALSKSLSNVVLSKGNTIIRNDASANGNVLGTIALGNGKYYWENYRHGGGNIGCGLTLASVDGSNHSAIHGSRVNYYQDGNIYQNGFGLSDINTGVTYSDTDIIGVSVDTEGGTIKFYKNGALVNNSSQTNSAFTYAQNELIPFWYSENGGEWRANMGNGYFGTTAITTNSGNGYSGAEGSSKFNYTVPTGYSALSTKGLNE